MPCSKDSRWDPDAPSSVVLAHGTHEPTGQAPAPGLGRPLALPLAPGCVLSWVISGRWQWSVHHSALHRALLPHRAGRRDVDSETVSGGNHFYQILIKTKVGTYFSRLNRQVRSGREKK